MWCENIGTVVCKHKDIYHTVFCMFPHRSLLRAYKPMRVKAEQNSEILAKLSPLYIRQLLLKVPKWTQKYNNIAGHDMKDNACAFILAKLRFKFRIYHYDLCKLKGVNHFTFL